MNKFSMIMRCGGFLALMILPALVQASSIGEAAQNLLSPTEVITKLATLACYAIGIVFLLMGIVQFRIHLQSPKLVPLGTPIMLVVFGIIALLFPYVTNLGGTTKVESQHTEKTNVLPLPTETPKGPGIPLPPTSQPVETPPPDNAMPATPPPPPAPSGGGWTSDPQYNQ